MSFGLTTEETSPGSFADFGNQVVQGGIKVHQGDSVKIAGAMEGEKKESGWKFEMGDSHVVSGPVNHVFLETKEKAETGDPNAEADLGRMYHWGTTVDKNYDEALKWFRKSSDQGNTNGQTGLGFMLFFGEGVTENDTEAARLFNLAADKGQIGAQYMLGMYYEKLAKYPEAINWFQKSSDQGNAQAIHKLGELYLRGQGVQKDPETAVEYFRKAAKLGFPPANDQLNKIQGMLGSSCVFTGTISSAIQEMKRKAETGDVIAEENLGMVLFNGELTRVDVVHGLEWIQKAAEQGNVEAELKLGVNSMFGIKVPQDIPKAMVWLEKASAGGSSLASRNMADIYMGGFVIDQNLPEARKWYKKAADQGDQKAAAELSQVP
jgi:uncharacterized protein